jgi:putative sigma-54 modulation protein
MKISYTARHANITPDIKKYCERRVKNLERLLDNPVEADITLSVEKFRKKVEINVKSKRVTLNVDEETHDMLSSLGVAFDHIERRIKKEREKLKKRKRRKSREREIFPPAMETAEERKRVIRSEDYTLKPLSIEEALLQFDLDEKKEIFVFRKMGSGKWAVLYRRKDGHYGLIEPE